MLDLLKRVLQHEVVAGPVHAAVVDDLCCADDVLLRLVAVENLLPDIGRARLHTHDDLVKADRNQLLQLVQPHHLRVRPDGERQVDVLLVLHDEIVNPAGRIRENLVVEVDEHQLLELLLRLDKLRHHTLDRAGADIFHALREHAVQIDDAAIGAGERTAARRDDLVAHRGELRVAVGHSIVLDVARAFGIDGGQPIFVDVLKQVADGVGDDLAVIVPVADRGEGAPALARGNGVCQFDHRDLTVGAHDIAAAEVEHAGTWRQTRRRKSSGYRSSADRRRAIRPTRGTSSS